MTAKGGPVRPVGTDLQERWQKKGQYEFGIKHEGRQPRDEGQPHAAEHEGHGNGKVQPVCEHREGHTDREKDQQKLEDMHGITMRRGWPRPPFIC